MALLFVLLIGCQRMAATQPHQSQKGPLPAPLPSLPLATWPQFPVHAEREITSHADGTHFFQLSSWLPLDRSVARVRSTVGLPEPKSRYVINLVPQQTQCLDR